MNVLRSDKVLYVDVDQTLVVWQGENYWPHKKHIQFLKQCSKRGQKVIVWSAGGFEWAERIVRELDLQSHVDLILSKPAWFMDDLKADKILPEENRVYFEE